MSNAFALQLPKFDPEPGSVVGDMDDGFDMPFDEQAPMVAFDEALPPLDDGMPSLDDALPLDGPATSEMESFDDEDHWVPEPEEPSPEAELAQKFEAVEKLTTELASSVQLLQVQIADRIEQKIQAIAAALFPKLAEDFLTEEIARFLAYAVPKNQTQIEITVPAPIEAELAESLIGVKALHNRWTIEAAAPGTEPTVKVDWGDGGFDYDLSALLAACHAHNFQNGNGMEE